MNKLRNPLHSLYEHKDEISSERLFIVLEKKTRKELARFKITDVPTLPKELLEKTFKMSTTTPDKKQTIFYVE